mmetsp:Transcript_45943/g.82160  ORF Transcript_45943/g.82160 Transcript_45943/m.82160 type:complete len:94 (-) Transcript_45943:900-1181(-)
MVREYVRLLLVCLNAPQKVLFAVCSERCFPFREAPATILAVGNNFRYNDFRHFFMQEPHPSPLSQHKSNNFSCSLAYTNSMQQTHLMTISSQN